jgi:hypothetical protein
MAGAVLKMLNFNQDKDQATEHAWKVLIYDKMGQDIISPLLKVGDLRENGVTIHMPLYSERQPIQDVPAIYFIEPTTDTIARICTDMQKRLYDTFYVNFSSALPRVLLEDFATNSSDCASLVSQVFDQYLNYTCLESNLFSLQINNAYVTLNDPHTAESVIESLTDLVAFALFSVLVTLS